jgi:hypothetical protein
MKIIKLKNQFQRSSKELVNEGDDDEIWVPAASIKATAKNHQKNLSMKAMMMKFKNQQQPQRIRTC